MCKRYACGCHALQVAESLVDIALKRYTSDNTSTFVVDLKQPGYWDEQHSKPKNMWSTLFGR